MLHEMTPAAMHERIAALIAGRSDIETLYYMMGSELLLEWAHSVGVATDAPMRDVAPPVPPLGLRRIVAAPTEPVFLWTGLKDAQMCLQYLKRHLGIGDSETARVLDFGCGCGRTTRYLQHSARLVVHGSDVNQQLVNWCQQNLENVSTTLNGVSPPLPFEDSSFDFVYSLSIFSHLSEASMQRWLSELGRVTVDDGIVLLTTHGLSAIRTICGSQHHRDMFRMSQEVADYLLERFADLRFRHFPYDADILGDARAGSDYGNAFVHQDYVKAEWLKSAFELIEFVEGGMRGWQDVVVLRRRPRAGGSGG